MESDRQLNTLNPSNHQFTQYLSQMQTEVGQSGKTLYQIFTEYLALKKNHESLAHALEAIDIPNSEELTPDQFKQNCELLTYLQQLREKNMQGISSLNEHPWDGFAHPDQTNEETEALLRTIRFVAIALNKFWVEFQSLPVFQNSMTTASISEIEKLFQWFQASPAWNERIQQSRVVPLMTQPDSRKQLMEFARDVKCVRVLYEELAEKQNPDLLNPLEIQTSYQLLSQGTEMAQKHQLENCLKADVEAKANETQKRLEKTLKIKKFFTTLNEQSDLPLPKNAQEAQSVFLALKCITRIPSSILPWRNPQVLMPGQLIRIEAWRDRARPLLDLRKKLDGHFDMTIPATSKKLREIASELTGGGLLKQFKAPFRKAMAEYESLVKPESQCRETPLSMGERLNDWANYLEQLSLFVSNSEVQKIFHPLFKGIDTGFTGAWEANNWAAFIRTELTPEGSPFRQALVNYIFTASPEKLQAAITHSNSTDAKAVQQLLDEAHFSSMKDFATAATAEELNLTELSQLVQIVTRVGIHSESQLSTLHELLQMTEEVLFLTKRIESNAELKHSMQSAYRGIHSDLEVIEQARSYVDFIQSAPLSEAMKTIFLSAKGSHRFGETKTFVASATVSLTTVKDHFQKLEAATFGQSTKIAQSSIPDLLVRIQKSTKQPSLLPDWVEYLKSNRDARAFGLGPILDYFTENELPMPQLETAYELAWTSSLLKKAIGQTPVIYAKDIRSILNQ
jgi:hypothetical protein